MTNEVTKIREIIEYKLQDNPKCIKTNAQITTISETQKEKSFGSWGKDVTGNEKREALNLIPLLKDDEVIILIDNILSIRRSDELANLDNYKIIYYTKNPQS